jgi:hypothetical protein
MPRRHIVLYRFLSFIRRMVRLMHNLHIRILLLVILGLDHSIRLRDSKYLKSAGIPSVGQPGHNSMSK